MVNLGPIRHLYPFQSRFLKIKNHRYHYVDEGKGEVLLMLHGNPTWSFYYRNLISFFSKKYRVIAPDHIGCGLSDKPQHYPYTLATHIKNLTILIDHLELKNITMIVHDWGGAIGMGYAMNHPKNIKRWIIFNTACFLASRLAMPWRIRLCHYPLIGSLAIRTFNLFSLGALSMAVSHRERFTREIREGYLAPYRSPHDRVAQLRFVQDIPWNRSVPSYAILQEMTSKLPLFKNHPMLIIWGKKDFCFTTDFLKKWESYFPNALINVIPDAGHYVVEDAWERMIPWIDDFLAATR